MSTSRAVAKGTLSLLTGQLSARALDFALYLILARTLGVSEFGSYTYAFSFTVLFNVLADFGVSIVFVRECSRAPDQIRRILGRTLRVKMTLIGITLLATMAAALASGSSRASLALILLFSGAMLLNSTALLFDGLLKSVGRAGRAGLTLCAQSITALAIGATLVLTGYGAMGGAIAAVCAAAMHAVAAAWLSRDLWRRPPGSEAEALRWRDHWELLKESAPLAVSGAFIALYFRVDAVLLHALQGSVAVGLYGSVYRLFEAFMLFNAAFRSVLFPFMARAADGPSEALATLCRKSYRVLMLFTVGLASFVTCRATTIVELVLGASYVPAAPALALLFWALPGAFTADMLIHALTAQRRQATGTRVVSLIAVFNVALNLILIPHHSFLGAAIATVASEALCALLLILAVRRWVPLSGLVRTTATPLLAGGVLVGALTAMRAALPQGLLGLAVSGAAALGIYVTALVLMRALGREDARVFLDLLPRSKPGSASRS